LIWLGLRRGLSAIALSRIALIAFAISGCAPLGAAVILVPTPMQSPVAEAERAAAPVTQPQVAVLPPAVLMALPVSPPPTMELSEFEGLNRFEVEELLGDPDLARNESTAQVLQYGIRADGNQADCALHLFLYRPQGGGPYRAGHAEILLANPGVSTQAACLTALLVRGAGG
jgi:hypothetical protein